MEKMKLLEEQKVVKKGGIKFFDTKKGIEIWAADFYTQELLAPIAIFYHNPGGFERFEEFKDILESKGYNPRQHGENSYLSWQFSLPLIEDLSLISIGEANMYALEWDYGETYIEKRFGNYYIGIGADLRKKESALIPALN